MRFLCRCGNMLTNQLDPNDTEYYAYSDREWSEFEKKGWIYFLDIPDPKYSEFVKSHPNIQVGDLLYFHNADETKDVNHATIISVVTESEIKYAGHTGSRDQYPLSDAIKHKEDGEYSYDYVYIIQMSDAV